MVNVDKLGEVADSATRSVAGAMAKLTEFLPAEWPPFAAVEGGFFTEEGYIRIGNTGHGAGTSMHCLLSDGFVAWSDSYEAPAVAWQAWPGTLFAGLAEAFEPFITDGVFERFGLHHHDYQREVWHAGNADMPRLSSIMDNVIARVMAAIVELDPLLQVAQLGASPGTFIAAQDFEWVTDSGFPETTLENLANTFANDPARADQCPHVAAGILPERVWDGFALEQLTKRHLAQRIIAQLQWVTTDGVQRSVRDEIFEAVRLWRTGSQTQRRGL